MRAKVGMAHVRALRCAGQVEHLFAKFAGGHCWPRVFAMWCAIHHL
jgi:hypothetical protein